MERTDRVFGVSIDVKWKNGGCPKNCLGYCIKSNFPNVLNILTKKLNCSASLVLAFGFTFNVPDFNMNK